jgi:hypothetical protein
MNFNEAMELYASEGAYSDYNGAGSTTITFTAKSGSAESLQNPYTTPLHDAGR